MKRFIRPVATMVVIACAGAAFAKDICVADNFGSHLRFYNVESLRPGGAIPLSGVYGIGFGFPCPLTGTAMLTTAGQLRVGITAYCAAPISRYNVVVTLTGTPDFTLSGDYDGNMDSLANEGVFTTTPEDCAGAPLP